jgi:hypothetical protein
MSLGGIEALISTLDQQLDMGVNLEAVLQSEAVVWASAPVVRL